MFSNLPGEFLQNLQLLVSLLSDRVGEAQQLLMLDTAGPEVGPIGQVVQSLRYVFLTSRMLSERNLTKEIFFALSRTIFHKNIS